MGPPPQRPRVHGLNVERLFTGLDYSDNRCRVGGRSYGYNPFFCVDLFISNRHNWRVVNKPV